MNRSEVLNHIQQVMKDFLQKHPQLSVNALSKRSDVSEATMRRILNDQVKTEPCGDTILEILVAVTKERKISELIKLYPGPIAEKLIQTFGIQAQEQTYQYIPDLERELDDEISYLVYKVSANTSGTTLDQIRNMFGIIGLERLEKLVQKELIIETEGLFHAKYKSFTLSNQVFLRNFKACAQFINSSKTRDLGENSFYNLSESLNRDAYLEVLKIQKNALKKIMSIVNDEKSVGDIPFFLLSAIDRFDHKALQESKKQLH